MTEPANQSVPLGGRCDARFEGVRAAFLQNFGDADDSEMGGAVSVLVEGRTVVDIWGGFIDSKLSTPWRQDTLVNAYSVGKGILAILALSCVESGELDLDASVASLWPEFAPHGKDRLTVREMLAHRSGLPGVREPLPADAMYDWDLMCRSLASQEPYWEPATAHGYHVNTQGFLVGEVLRRATGTPVGDLLRQRLTGPLGADYYYGLPTSEHGRVSTAFVHEVDLDVPELRALAFPPTGDAAHDTMIWRTYANPKGISGMGSVNTKAWREAVIPSTNSHGTARAVAAIYAAYLAGGPHGVPWAGKELRAEAVTIHSDGDDIVLGRPSRFGLGFQLPQPTRPIGPNAAAFGHFGYGGTLGMADPDTGLAFAYVTNRPGLRWQTTRTQRLMDAVYEAL